MKLTMMGMTSARAQCLPPPDPTLGTVSLGRENGSQLKVVICRACEQGADVIMNTVAGVSSGDKGAVEALVFCAVFFSWE